MPPPRKITYNGRTVCNPSAAIFAGRRYHSQFRLLGNDIVFDNQQAAILLYDAVENGKISSCSSVLQHAEAQGWILRPRKLHDDLCHHFLGVFHPIDSFILFYGKGFFLDRLLDCMIPTLGGCSFDRDIIYVSKLFKFCLIILLEI